MVSIQWLSERLYHSKIVCVISVPESYLTTYFLTYACGAKMKFTLVFSGHENEELSVGSIFVPCLLWTRGRAKILNPHPENPLYQKGDFQDLLERTAIGDRIKGASKGMCLVVHDRGHGTSDCLKNLEQDLADSGFETEVVNI